MIQYSVTTSDRALISCIDQIDVWLREGIKFLFFGNSKYLQVLKDRYAEFIEISLLQLYQTEKDIPCFTVYDGLMEKVQERSLITASEACTSFNYEQYQIEHAPADRSMIIEAGAGTGKTTVMIDRIMFLVHTQPDITMEDIAMITFTNEATQHMRHKVQDVLLKRYKVTKNPKYVRYLEDESKMRTHTIHSFSKDIITELGPELGYSIDLKLRSFKYEKRQLIRDVLDEHATKHKGRVNNALGLVLYKLEQLLLTYWNSMVNSGISDDGIVALDWGIPEDEESKALHETIRSSFSELYLRYNQLKQSSDSIAVGDIIHELRRMLDENPNPVFKSRPVKFLFVDEFQDSDNAQIKTIVWLMKLWKFKLFAVGDIKQSIYRFRGAVATAFRKLICEMDESGFTRPDKYILTRNYRTSADILGKLDTVFCGWETRHLIEYGAALSAQKHFRGSYEIRPVSTFPSQKRLVTINILKDCLQDCIREAKLTNSENKPAQHVTVLTRTNAQLKDITRWCEESCIPCYLRSEGSFFSSRAVRDFMAMISAYEFSSSAVYKYNYLMSSYGPGSCDVESLALYTAGSREQNDYLDELLSYVGWESNKRAFRLMPALSVIREIMNIAAPAKKFMTIRKEELISHSGNWPEEKLNKQVFLEALQYEKNTEKLMQIVRKHFSGDFSSLNQIYRFILLNIQTNRDEDEPDISEHTGCECVYGMTVHKAKGLEFDTVVIPFTGRKYRRDVQTELLINDETEPKQAGWCCAEYQDYQTLNWSRSNSYYKKFVEAEFKATDEEEARLLYVAMTRSIRRLICIKELVKDVKHSWSGLLEV